MKTASTPQCITIITVVLMLGCSILVDPRGEYEYDLREAGIDGATMSEAGMLDANASDGGADARVQTDGGPCGAIGDACCGGMACVVGSCVDGTCCDVPATVLPLTPENGARTGSVHAASNGTLRPTFRWRPASCGGATYELQVDDSCSTPGFERCVFPSPEVDEMSIESTSFAPEFDLSVSTSAPVGTRYYWRVRSCAGDLCGNWSITRYVDVGRVRNDFNGDGWSDIVVGAPTQDAEVESEGRAFVYYGSASGPPTTPDVTLDQPFDVLGAQFSASVASAGDLNADGFSDLLVGSFAAQTGAFERAGKAFVYHGGPSGLPTVASVELVNPDGQDGGEFGASVSSAGDVDGDGFADAIVGARRQSSGASNGGSAFVYTGSESSVSDIPAVRLDNPDDQANAFFGDVVATVGDLDGDGFADIAVGARFQDGVGMDEGAAFIYSGGPTGPSSVPSVRLGNPDEQASGAYGHSIAGADLDADGFSDLIVGAPGQSSGSVNGGAVFIYQGRDTGLSPTAAVSLTNPADELGEFGSSVACSGDVDLDGHPDLIVGAPRQTGSAANSGKVFIYGEPLASPVPSVRLDSPDGSDSHFFGASLSVRGDVDGDGFADLAVGGFQLAAGIGSVLVYEGASTGIELSHSIRLDNPVAQPGEFGRSVAAVWQRAQGPMVPTPISPAIRLTCSERSWT